MSSAAAAAAAAAAVPASKAQGQGQAVDLSQLSLPQLRQVKAQLDDEIEHLSSSFQKLRVAQSKFRDCVKSVRDGVRTENKSKSILVPLTTSLYVPGRLSDNDKVLVDVGTGFYVEKTTKDAITFYTAKIEELDKNLKDLEQVVQGKSNTVRVVEEGMELACIQLSTTERSPVLRQKLLSSNNDTTAAS